MSERNLNNPKLAAAIGLTKQSVYNFMNGNTQLTLDNLEKIANYFKVPITYLFEEGEKVPGNMVNEAEGEYGSMFEQLKSENQQLRDQIKFLQHIIETKL